ncbi:MAG TPA: hypothetical protein VFQ85_12685 [Mycobacteriales bacterium]|jgi:hypothetical protein|nr:hypothetical protein [Mycobacteriales bacterium]
MVGQADVACGMTLTLAYSDGTTVRLCWQASCRATIREAAPPTTNCGPPGFDRPYPRQTGSALDITYDPRGHHCVAVVGWTGAGDGDPAAGCEWWQGCADDVWWTFGHDPFALLLGASVCGDKVQNPYVRPPLKAPELAGARPVRVLGGRHSRPNRPSTAEPPEAATAAAPPAVPAPAPPRTSVRRPRPPAGGQIASEGLDPVRFDPSLAAPPNAAAAVRHDRHPVLVAVALLGIIATAAAAARQGHAHR